MTTTKPEIAGIPTGVVVFIFILLFLIFLFGIITNGLVMWALTHSEKDQPSSTEVPNLLSKLMSANVLFMCGLLPYQMSLLFSDTNKDHIACSVVAISMQACIAVSATLSCIYGFHQWTKITDPKYHGQMFTGRKVAVYFLGSLCIDGLMFIVFPFALHYGEFGYYTAAHLCTIKLPVNFVKQDQAFLMYWISLVLIHFPRNFLFIVSQGLILYRLNKQNLKAGKNIRQLLSHHTLNDRDMSGLFLSRVAAKDSGTTCGSAYTKMTAAMFTDFVDAKVQLKSLSLRSIFFATIKLVAISLYSTLIALMKTTDKYKFSFSILVVSSLILIPPVADSWVIYNFNPSVRHSIKNIFRKIGIILKKEEETKPMETEQADVQVEAAELDANPIKSTLKRSLTIFDEENNKVDPKVKSVDHEMKQKGLDSVALGSKKPPKPMIKRPKPAAEDAKLGAV